MAGLSTNAPGLWGGFAGLLYGSTSLSTPPGFLADATPAWVPAGGVLAFEFDNGLGYNSRNLATTTPDSILTYTSPSPKLIYGSDGVLRYAPHNLCLRSQSLATSPWSLDNSGAVNPTVTENYAAAPDGTLTATRVQLNKTGGTYSRLQQIIAGTQIATFSVYMKTTTAPSANVGIRIEGIGVNCEVTTEWQRFSVSLPNPGSSFTSQILLFDSIVGNDETADILVWGAQLNLGSSALTYIPTTTAAVYSLPIDHNPTTFAPLGVLIEEERKNLLQWSEQFDNAAWTKESSTSAIPVVNPNQGTAPDGTMTADKITFGIIDAAGDVSIVRQSITSAISAYSGSIYLKAFSGADVGKQIAVYVNDGSALAPIYHTLTAGWVRVVASKTTTAAVTTYLTIGTLGSTYGGVNQGAAEAFVWGAQLEAGAFATSYIPTTNNPLGVTRLADQVSILTSAFAYVNDGYTLYSEMSGTEPGFYSYQIGFQQNSGITDGAWFTTNTTAGVNGRVRSGGGDSANFNPAPSVSLASGFVKQVLVVATNDFAYTKNGNTVAVDGTGAVPSGITKLSLLFYLNGKFHIKRLTYFPTRRSDADLQVLTT